MGAETSIFSRGLLGTALGRFGAAVTAITSTTSFILSSNEATTSYWFIVGGKVFVLEYIEAYGEGPAPFPGDDDPIALRAVRESLGTQAVTTRVQFPMPAPMAPS